MAVALKLSVPVVTDFVASEIPSLWSFVLSWLKPPYLYVLINCIIISIVASSKFQNKVDDPPPPSPEMMRPPAEVVKISGEVAAGTDYAMYSNGVGLTGYGYDPNDVAATKAPAIKVSEAQVAVEKEESDPVVVMNGDDVAVASSIAWNGLERKDSLEYYNSFSNENEKPPVSARFGHRKSVKASPEGTFFILFINIFFEINFDGINVIKVEFVLCRREGVESFEAEEARHAGEHVENDNGGPCDAVNEAPKEVRHVGVARAK